MGLEDFRAVDLPFSGELAFGLGEGKNSEGKLLAAVIERFPDRSSPSGGLITSRAGGVSTTPIAPIGTRKWKMYHPAWPLEILDGSEAVVWGVFVGEAAESAEALPAQERAKHAEAAWLFTVGTGELPKNK